MTNIKRYLLRTEFGDWVQKDTLPQEDLDASDSGYIEIVDTQEAKVHIGGNKWQDIGVYKDDDPIITFE